MNESFGIASFRSRQQVFRFEAALRRDGIPVSVITTPRDVAVGCGLSVRFELRDTAAVFRTLDKTRPGNLIGVYRVDRTAGARSRLTVLSKR